MPQSSFATPLQDGNSLAPLPATFYARDPVTVARALLGMFLVREDNGDMMVGRIVETEAYLASQDPACHGARGQTPRNATMFGPPGYAYVYAIHRYHCVNVVTEAPGVPSAVLIRALEPLQGLEAMHQRRHTDHPVNLTSGPGKVCQALAIDRTLDAWDLTRGSRLWITASPSPPPSTITATPRIGVTSARELPLRFHEAANPFVSPGKRGKSTSPGGHDT